MVLRRITLAVRLDFDAVRLLKTTYPTIIQDVVYQGGKTIFFVDITPQQETQIRPVLMDAIIKIEDQQ
jgi:hypothetical protein